MTSQQSAADSPVHVHVVGAGLIGASVGLGLAAAGWDVTIDDADGDAAALAWSIGAGRKIRKGEQPAVVVVAVPPAHCAHEVVDQLRAWPDAAVTDVSSVKGIIADAVHAAGGDDRYVGSHPMAGREVSGGLNAQGDLFQARPWVLCPNGARDSAVEAVRGLAHALGGDVVVMDADRHDRVVARVSHAPQMAASAVAAALGSLDGGDVSLAGQGLRDVTRIAASEPGMWSQIAALNSEALRDTLDHIIGDLERVRDGGDIAAAVGDLVERGAAGAKRIPGKHGGKTRAWAGLTVVVPDSAGQLLRLLSDVADAGVNIEDLVIEHSPRQPVGLTTLYVDPSAATDLAARLEEQGWQVPQS